MSKNHKNEWLERPFARQYTERLLQELTGELTDSTSFIEEIALQQNYGFIIKTAEVLTAIDVTLLMEYFVRQLIAVGYTESKRSANQINMQASVRNRVNGIQLYGNIKIVRKSSELRILVTPYTDRQYKEAIDKLELMNVLLS